MILLTLLCLPLTVQGFSVERVLGAGEFYAAYRNAETGWRIEGSFTATDDIDFFICDSGNFTNWLGNETVVLYEHVVETTGHLYNFSIPYNSTWYVVFSNNQPYDSTSLESELYFIDDSGVTQEQIMWTVQSTWITPVFLAILIGFTVLCLLGIWAARKSEPFPAVEYDKILSQ